MENCLPAVAGIPVSILHLAALVVHSARLAFVAWLGWVVIGRRFRQKVGRHKTALSAQFAQVEPVVVHVSVDVNDVARLERELHFRVHVWRQFLRIVVVQGDHPFDGHVGINVAPTVPSLAWLALCP